MYKRRLLVRFQSLSVHLAVHAEMAHGTREALQDKLLGLPCHFSWESLQSENVGRPVEMNIENLEEHIHEAIQGTEVMSYNLMGFYKTQQGHFEQARANFKKALKYCKTEDERIVSLGCLAWLTWKESSSGSSSDEQVVELINQVQEILRGRNPEGIPEVMAEKAFAIANSGFTEKGFKQALDCIDKALEKTSGDVMYKFTKAILLHQFYHKKHKQKSKDEAEAQKIKQLFEEIIGSLEATYRHPVLYAQVLAQYALFLNKINQDNGASGKEYAEKAEKVVRSLQATAVMRNVARFYIQSAGETSYSELRKAEDILNEILKSKPGHYKALTELGNCLARRLGISPRSADTTFPKAEKCFLKAWKFNKKYITPALDLVRLYQMKYDQTTDYSALAKANKIFQELFSDYEEKENLYKSKICSRFGEFMKGYGRKLASFYFQSCPVYQSAAPVRSPRIEEALQLIQQYTQDRQEVHLLQAEQVFNQLYNSWEELRDPVKALFLQEYAAFLEDFADDLAFYYLTKSLEHNPHQGYAYKPLKKLARKKLASTDKEERIKGHRTMKWIKELQMTMNKQVATD